MHCMQLHCLIVFQLLPYFSKGLVQWMDLHSGVKTCDLTQVFMPDVLIHQGLEKTLGAH